MVELEDVGEIKELKVIHVNQDNGCYEWYLGCVTLQQQGHRNPRTFRVQETFKQLSGELTVHVTPNNNSNDNNDNDKNAGTFFHYNKL